MRPRFIRQSGYLTHNIMPFWPEIAKNEIGWYASILSEGVVMAAWIALRPVRAPEARHQWTSFTPSYPVEAPGRLIVGFIRTLERVDPHKWSADDPHYRLRVGAWPFQIIHDRVTPPERLNQTLFRLDELVERHLMEEAL